jgi:uncharacterized membrane protein
MPYPLIATYLLLGQAPDATALSPAGLVNAVVPLVGLIGVGVMLWGAYHALLQQLTLESATLRAQMKPDANRLPFSHYLALGLEFMVAASAIKTLNDYSLEQVAVLGGLVISRVMVGLYPRWDVRTDRAAAAAAPSAVTVPAETNPQTSSALAGMVAEVNATGPIEAEAAIGNPPVVTLAS